MQAADTQEEYQAEKDKDLHRFDVIDAKDEAQHPIFSKG